MTSHDGIPIDAKDWTEADWQDLHEAIEKVKRNVAARHKPTEAEYVLVRMIPEGHYHLHIWHVATGKIVGRYYDFSRKTAEKHLQDWNEGRRK